MKAGLLLLLCGAAWVMAQTEQPPLESPGALELDLWSAADVEEIWRKHLHKRLIDAPAQSLLVETYCRHALRLDAGDVPVAARLAEYYLEKGEMAMSGMGLLYLRLLDDTHPLVRLHWGSVLRDLEVFEPGPLQLDDIAPDSSVADVLRRAALAQQERRWIRAENLYRVLLSRFPTNLIFIRALGNVYIRQESWHMVVMLHRYALHLYPDEADIANNYALGLDKMGRRPAAIEVLRINLDRHPKDAMLARNLGRLLWDVGNADEAAEAFAAWTAAQPNNPDAWRAYGDSLLRKDKLIFAKVAFRKAMELDPDDLGSPEMLVRLGLVEGRSEDVERWGRALKARMEEEDWQAFLRRSPFSQSETLREIP